MILLSTLLLLQAYARFNSSFDIADCHLYGLLHDIRWILPITLVDGLGFMFPFITVWFLIISIGILATEFFRIDFRRTHKALRPVFHLSYLAATFWLTRYFELSIG